MSAQTDIHFSLVLFTQARIWEGSLARMAGSGPGYTNETIITPNIHILVYHVPTMIPNHGSLKYFSDKGNMNFNNEVKLYYV